MFKMYEDPIELLSVTNVYLVMLNMYTYHPEAIGPQPCSLSPQDMFALPDNIKKAILTSEVL